MQSEIKIDHLDSISIKVRLHPVSGQITTLSIEAKMSPSDIARLLNMQKQGAPISVVIGTDQFLLDLDIKPAAIQVPGDE